MSAIVGYILGALTAASGLGALFVFLLLNPEKIEKWSALVWRGLAAFKTVFRGAHKQYIKHDLQGRINEFAKGLQGEAPYLSETRVQVEWIDADVTRKSFLEDGKVILRLRRDDREEMNFVHGGYMFVSTSLLAKTKRYISPSQSQAIDLYVTTKLFEKEKAAVVGVFLEEYLHTQVGETGSKLANYYDSMAKLDKSGLFYPVLLQELDFLGAKVFGRRQDDKIISEVNSLIEFLAPIASRKIGDEGDLDFERDYCCFAIMIVGKPGRLAEAGAQPYITFVKTQLAPRNIETIYVLGRQENRAVLDLVSSGLETSYERLRSRRSKVTLRYDDQEVERDQYLIVLRRRGIAIYRPAA